MESPVDGDGVRSFPSCSSARALANGLVRFSKTLGLERKAAKVKTLDAYLTERSASI